MPESPRRVDLRLTIPASQPYTDVAVELAEKFAEYAGADAAAAKSLARDVGQALAPATATPDTPVDMELSAQDREVVVTTNGASGSKRATCPLTD